MTKKTDFVSCPICGSPSFSIMTFRFDSGRIVRCQDCGHIYLNPTLTDSQLAIIYENYHLSEDEGSYIKMIDGWFDDPNGPYQYSLLSIDKLCGFKNKRLLDVGCGPGRFLSECKKRGAIVSGVDSSLRAAQLAQKYFNLDVIAKPLEEAMRVGDLHPSRFDIIAAFEVVEHVKKPAELLKSIHRLLAPGGLVFISTPNFYLYYSMGKAAPSLKDYAEHLHFFDAKSLADCLKRCHYDMERVVSLNPMAFGERKKRIFANIPIIKKAWQALRRIRAAYIVKDSVFKLLDQHKDNADRMAWNGTSLLCIARKPAEA